MKSFTTIVNGYYQLTIVAKLSIFDICKSRSHASANDWLQWIIKVKPPNMQISLTC